MRFGCEVSCGLSQEKIVRNEFLAADVKQALLEHLKTHARHFAEQGFVQLGIPNIRYFNPYFDSNNADRGL